MKNYYDILKNIYLFTGIEEEKFPEMLKCLNSYEKSFTQNEIIIMAGQAIENMGIVLKGTVQVIREDFSGSRTIITELSAGDIFAEAFACDFSGGSEIPVSVLSVSQSKILFINFKKIIQNNTHMCAFRSRLISNMITILSQKNITLNRRIGHLSKRSTREKLLSYLFEQSVLNGSNEFKIPFNRRELADYLCVERSAMSAVLSSLQKENIISFRKNHFIIKETPDI